MYIDGDCQLMHPRLMRKHIDPRSHCIDVYMYMLFACKLTADAACRVDTKFEFCMHIIHNRFSRTIALFTVARGWRMKR